jgi:serine/threonine protein kinase/tetratricopeptide (TPR) repeat protein
VSKSEGAPLLPLAESIADGSAVDWEAAEARATSDERAIIQQLRVLSNLAGLHRSMPRRAAARPPLPSRVSDSPAIGSWGHLALLERLGGGTFGDVYRVWDNHLEREVALKLLKIDDSVQDLQASRIATEGRLLARVRHTNVITVHGVDLHDHRVGLWMELVRGATLEQGLREHGPLSAREAALAGIDLCRALAAIHGAGLIHRDVKAQNVMREDGGRIVLMDLGTGREVDRTGHGSEPDLAGTPLYLAPEIFNGSPASERTDLYSLGVLLYHLVTGAFPVRATTVEELKVGHDSGSGVRLRDARADLPTAFVQVVDRATASDPARRYASAGAFEAALVEALDASAVAGPRFWTWRGLALWSAAAATVVAISALAVPSVRHRFASPPALVSSRDGVLVAEFFNRTGEAVFDGTLKEALTIQIQQSPYLNASAARNVESGRANRSGSRPLESSVARELCRRRRMNALVVGSIALRADRYVIDVEAQNCDTGETIAKGEREASSRATVLQALGMATDEVRAKLGESQTSIRQFNVPVEDATTSSLDALRSYSLGMDTRAKGGEAEAIPFFTHALELDPRFALAEGRLGAIYANLREFEQSKVHIEKAYELSGHVTERERLYIRGSYHLNVAGRLDEAEGAYRLWMQLYPLDWTPHNNIAALYHQVGRFDDALKEAEVARSLGVDRVIPYEQLALTNLALGRFAESKRIVGLAESRGLSAATNRAVLMEIALIESGPAAVRAMIEAPLNRAADEGVVATAARAEAFSGDLPAARSLIAQAVAKAQASRMNDYASSLIAEDALNAAVAGEYGYARKAIDRSLGISRGSETLWSASLAAALSGNRSLAERLTGEYVRIKPPSTDVVAVSAPILRAANQFAAGNSREAIELLQAAIPYERVGRFWPAYLRGLSYLRLNQPTEAAKQFQAIVAHREQATTSILFNVASLQLGRAHRAAGRSSEAKAAYDTFIAAWQAAPREQPLLRAALRERSRLSR